jgi:hypothetical protein
MGWEMYLHTLARRPGRRPRRDDRGWPPLRGGPRPQPGLLAWRSQAALALLQLAEQDEAHQLTEEELQLARILLAGDAEAKEEGAHGKRPLHEALSGG